VLTVARLPIGKVAIIPQSLTAARLPIGKVAILPQSLTAARLPTGEVAILPQSLTAVWNLLAVPSDSDVTGGVDVLLRDFELSSE
jgi:hypothetical protein